MSIEDWIEKNRRRRRGNVLRHIHRLHRLYLLG